MSNSLVDDWGERVFSTKPSLFVLRCMRLPVSWHLACTDSHTRILMAVMRSLPQILLELCDKKLGCQVKSGQKPVSDG